MAGRPVGRTQPMVEAGGLKMLWLLLIPYTLGAIVTLGIFVNMMDFMQEGPGDRIAIALGGFFFATIWPALAVGYLGGLLLLYPARGAAWLARQLPGPHKP